VRQSVEVPTVREAALSGGESGGVAVRGVYGEFAKQLKGKELADLEAFYGEVRKSLMDDAELTDDMRDRSACSTAGSVVALLLHRNGWVLSAEPGNAVKMTKGAMAVEPFKVTKQLGAGQVERVAMLATMQGWNLASRNLEDALSEVDEKDAVVLEPVC
jgi:hypothetical protein